MDTLLAIVIVMGLCVIFAVCIIFALVVQNLFLTFRNEISALVCKNLKLQRKNLEYALHIQNLEGEIEVLRQRIEQNGDEAAKIRFKFTLLSVFLAFVALAGLMQLSSSNNMASSNCSALLESPRLHAIEPAGEWVRFVKERDSLKGAWLVAHNSCTSLVSPEMIKREYRSAFRLPLTCTVDVPFSPDKGFAWGQLEASKNGWHPEAHTCQLQLTLTLAIMYYAREQRLHPAEELKACRTTDRLAGLFVCQLVSLEPKAPAPRAGGALWNKVHSQSQLLEESGVNKQLEFAVLYQLVTHGAVDAAAVQLSWPELPAGAAGVILYSDLEREYVFDILLRERQVEVVRSFAADVEAGSTHVQSSDAVVTLERKEAWTAQSLLRDVAAAARPIQCLVDTGALITGIDNEQAACYLLAHLPAAAFEGVVYLDRADRKIFLQRSSGKSLHLLQCGVAPTRRFTSYDQVHTTGMDIAQAPDARTVVTVGKDTPFRDYAQGAFRMLGIGNGQTVVLFLIPEVEQLIKNGLHGGKALSQAKLAKLTVKTLDVPAWQLINSMRMEAVQYSMLSMQERNNSWRKEALKGLLSDCSDNAPSVEGAPLLQTPAERLCRFKDTENNTAGPSELKTEKGKEVQELIVENAGFARGAAAVAAAALEAETVDENEQQQQQQPQQQVNAPSGRMSALSVRASQPKPSFPFDPLLSDNWFRSRWTGLGDRRLKNVVVVMEWALACFPASFASFLVPLSMDPSAVALSALATATARMPSFDIARTHPPLLHQHLEREERMDSAPMSSFEIERMRSSLLHQQVTAVPFVGEGLPSHSYEHAHGFSALRFRRKRLRGGDELNLSYVISSSSKSKWWGGWGEGERCEEWPWPDILLFKFILVIVCLRILHELAHSEKKDNDQMPNEDGERVPTDDENEDDEYVTSEEFEPDVDNEAEKKKPNEEDENEASGENEDDEYVTSEETEPDVDNESEEKKQNEEDEQVPSGKNEAEEDEEKVVTENKPVEESERGEEKPDRKFTPAKLAVVIAFGSACLAGAVASIVLFKLLRLSQGKGYGEASNAGEPNPSQDENSPGDAENPDVVEDPDVVENPDPVVENQENETGENAKSAERGEQESSGGTAQKKT